MIEVILSYMSVCFFETEIVYKFFSLIMLITPIQFPCQILPYFIRYNTLYGINQSDGLAGGNFG